MLRESQSTLARVLCFADWQALVHGAVGEQAAGRADTTAWVAIGVLGLLCMAAAFALYYELIARAGATRAALTTYFSPLVSVPLGAHRARQA